MKMANTEQACQSAGLDGYKKAHAMGNAIDAKIDPSDTNLVRITIQTKAAKLVPNASGTKARNAPAEVATPLPPLNPINGENVCPKIDETPTANDHS